jgi:proline dehydrogenase
MSTSTTISFDNTEYAFEYKKNSDLKNAHFLFSVIGKPWLVNLALKLTPWAIKWNLPFVKLILRKTIFQQFVGGQNLEETAGVVSTLNSHNVQVILDYGVEGGEDGEQGFDCSAREFIKVIDYAAKQDNIPFMSIKVTGLSRFALLEKIDTLMNHSEGSLMDGYLKAIELLSHEEKQEWEKVKNRLHTICERASKNKVGVLIDAEETWIQDPVDALTLSMMDLFNRDSIVVYNTLQLYRIDRLKFLKDCYEAAVERGFILGVKLVRGAYMENERKRAAQMNYPSPIQVNKENCDRDFNDAIKFSILHINKISVIVASHNEQSNLYSTQLLAENGLSSNHPHVHFSQLYGMSDNITFNLAKAGYSVSKYLPFGPIKDVVPYLMRRAQENSSVSGQMGRELGLLKKEINRRKHF